MRKNPFAVIKIEKILVEANKALEQVLRPWSWNPDLRCQTSILAKNDYLRKVIWDVDQSEARCYLSDKINTELANQRRKNELWEKNRTIFQVFLSKLDSANWEEPSVEKQ